MCDLDVMDVPSKVSVIRKVAALARVRPTFVFSCEMSLKNKSRTNSLCNLPDVFVIGGILYHKGNVDVR